MTLHLSTAYLLVSHGSRDPRPEVAVKKLARLLADRLAVARQPTALSAQRHSHWNRIPGGSLGDREGKGEDSASPLVGTAQLELHPLPLHQQILEFSDRAASLGCERICILPLFLLPGVHVMEDIPEEVQTARQLLGESRILDVRPHLGRETLGLTRLVASQIQGLQAKDPRDRPWILVSHGSRREGANTTVEEMAQRLDAVTAYWSRSPSLEERVEQLRAAGDRQIGIVPYFLFTGGITDAIGESVRQLSQQQPPLEFQLAEPLGPSDELADLILHLTQK